MTTIAKLFADARQGVQNISGRTFDVVPAEVSISTRRNGGQTSKTDHFTNLDIGGESYHGTLFVGKHMRRRLRIWNCLISAHHDTGGISFIYSFQGADANEALDKVERKVVEHAAMKIGMMP